LAIIHTSHDLGLTCGTYCCGGNVEIVGKERDNRESKGDKVPLWKIVFKEMIWFGLRYPPFWFSMLKSKKATLILLEGKYSLGRLIISSKLSYTISTLDSSASNTEGHTKLIDRLSSPLIDLFTTSHTLPRNRHQPN